jgi:putative hemolysin
MKSSDNKKFIDVDAVFKAKNPGLYRLLPSFILSYLKKTVHQDEINDFINRQGHKKDLEFVDSIIEEFGAKIRSKGTENIPETGGCIIASNHPLGGLDAMALIQSVGRRRKDIKFIVNDILLEIKSLSGLFAGVDKHGKNSQEILDSIDRLYASGIVVLIFPAGLVSRKSKTGIKDLEWKKSFVTKARKYKLDIIPVYIEGRNSEFFYNFANLRKKIGIGSNIEMLYLPDEMYRQKNRTITVIFGKAIPYTMLDETRSDKEWAKMIREHVYTLPKGEKSFGSHSEE